MREIQELCYEQLDSDKSRSKQKFINIVSKTAAGEPIPCSQMQGPTVTSLSMGCSPGKGTWSHDSVTGKVRVLKTTVAPSDSTPGHFPRNICFPDVFGSRIRSYFFLTSHSCTKTNRHKQEQKCLTEKVKKKVILTLGLVVV